HDERAHLVQRRVEVARVHPAVEFSMGGVLELGKWSGSVACHVRLLPRSSRVGIPGHLGQRGAYMGSADNRQEPHLQDARLRATVQAGRRSAGSAATPRPGSPHPRSGASAPPCPRPYGGRTRPRRRPYGISGIPGTSPMNSRGSLLLRTLGVMTHVPLQDTLATARWASAPPDRN